MSASFEKYVLKNARVIQSASNVIDDGCVFVDGAKIKYVGSVSDSDFEGQGADYVSIDLNGMTIMPAFIDAHVHSCWSGEPNLPSSLNGKGEGYIGARIINNMIKTLESGFVSVRDLGCPGRVSYEIRDVIKSKLFTAAQMVCSGPPLTMTGGHTWFISKEVDGRDEVRKAVRQSVKDGSDCIKLIATGGVLSPSMEPGSEQLSEEEIRVAVEEAHKRGIKVTVHAIGTSGILNALRAGVDCIEHGVYLNSEAIDLMLEKNVTFVPTLSAVDTMVRYGKQGGLPQYSIDKANRVYDHHRSSVEKAIEEGVKVAFGTDAGTPFNYHGENRLEFKLLASLGMSETQCIASATTIAADCMGISNKTGQLKNGLDANIVGYSKNPMDDVCVLNDVPELIIFEGRKVQGSIESLAHKNIIY